MENTQEIDEITQLKNTLNEKEKVLRETVDKVHNLRKEVSELTNKNDQLEQNNKILQEHINSNKVVISNLELENKSFQSKINDLSIEKESVISRINELEDEKIIFNEKIIELEKFKPVKEISTGVIRKRNIYAKQRK